MPLRSISISPPLFELVPLAPATTVALHDVIAPGDSSAVLGAYPGVTFFMSYYADHAGSLSRDRLGYFSILISFDGVTYYEQKRIAIQQGIPRILGPFTVRTPYFRIDATSEQLAGDITLDWALSYDDNSPADYLADSSLASERPEVTANFTTSVEEDVVAFAMKIAAGVPASEDVSDPSLFTIPTFTDDPQEMHVLSTAGGTFRIYGRASSGDESLLASIPSGGSLDTNISLDVANGGGVSPFRFIRCTWDSTIEASTDVTVLMAFKK
jgi:hypothetical protein